MPTVIVRMKVKPSKEQEFLSILREVAHIVKSEETDCVIYAAWATSTPYHYYHMASYRDQAGLDTHERLHKETIGPRFLPCLEGNPEVERLGLDVAFVTKDDVRLA